MASEEQPTNSELKDLIDKLLKTQGDVMTKLETVSSEVKHLTYRLSQVEKTVESVTSSRSDQGSRLSSYQEMETVRGSITTAVAFTSPFNVVFYGIPNRQGMSLDAIFRNFMVESLHIDQATAFKIPLHVQYLPKMSQEDAHFPICVTFRDHRDREYVCHKTSKYGQQLQYMNISAEGLHERMPAIWKSCTISY